MGECKLLEGCIFFNDEMKDMEGLAELYKNMYCLGDNSNCARFIVADKLGRENVPKDLYPNMFRKASELIAKG